MTFADLGLSQKVLDAVESAGYREPTPIQAQAIPHVLQRRDVLGIAQTGTGKTASFTLPMLTLLEKGRARARMPRTLILEPTRELAAQVEENFEKYGINHKLNVALIIGGVSFGDQDAKITRGVDVLIATPGRLLDHFERGKLLLTGIEILVIDEADRMLDMGFIPDIERICKLVPFTRQTLFFSATMPPEIQRLTEQFLHNPVQVEVARPSSTSVNITQNLIRAGREPAEKRDVLRGLIKNSEGFKNAIIFCNRKRDVAVVHRSLEKHGFSAVALHGDLDQRARLIALDSFKKGEAQLLVASDVAARGLDIPDVSHVFNYDMPTHAEDYVHRIGRTARAGRSGTATTLVTSLDTKLLAAIESLIETKIGWLDSPPPPAEADEDSSDKRRGSEKRQPGRRSGRSRSGSATAPARETSAAEAAVSSPARPERERRPSESKARPEQERRPERAARPEREPRPEREARPVREARPERESRPAPARPAPERRHRDDDDGPAVVGLGDHVPSFLLRPVRIGKA